MGQIKTVDQTFRMHESETDNDTRKKPLSPSSSPPLPTSSRRRSGRRQADNIKEFDRGINGSNRGQLWSPTKLKAQTLDQQPKPLSQAKPAQYKIGTEEAETEAEADDLYVADPSVSQMIQQPDTRPISQEQLVAEVKGIYAGLVMVESKCIEVDNAQSADKGSHSPQQLTDVQWQALIALHRTLLHEHHDFFLASQHPSASPALRRLASKYAMPARMWRHGIHSFLELLRHRLPLSLEHMLSFIYIAYSMMALLYETVPAFEDTWIECLGDLGRYRMAIEDDDIKDRETWTAVSRYWYNNSKVSNKLPTTGRLYHHLAILSRANALQQTYYYAKSLCVFADPSLRRPASKDTMSARMRQHEILGQLTQQLLNSPGFQEQLFSDAADKQYYVAGTVNGTVVEALPDTGADGCFISSKLASHLGLRPVPGTQKRISLANNRIVESPGMVKVPWEFARERTTHTITCWILPGCIRDLVLGNHFLRATHTLTKFRNRIKSKLLRVSKRLSLSFLGNEKQRLRGYLNGHLATALPDTGSDAMFLNGEFARKLGLDIDSNVRNLVEVELANGSTTMTSGIVRDVHWKVGKTTVQCNFYVLEDLCADIILSNTYLFDMNIFSEQEKHFFDIDSEDHFKDYLFHFCNLRLVKKNHVASPSAFSPDMTQQELEQLEQWEKLEELHKRDENRDRIMRLPEDQQEKAAQDEKARQQCWEALRKERKAKWAAGSHTTKENVQNGGSLIGRLKKRLRIGVAPRKVAT